MTKQRVKDEYRQYRRWHKHPEGLCSCRHLYVEHSQNGCSTDGCPCRLRITEQDDKYAKRKIRDVKKVGANNKV